jgi:hypothetical protein
VDAAVAQATAAAAGLPDASADALNELHAVLTPPQRAALVDKVESHWAVWQKANAEEGAGTSAERGHLATLDADLGLAPEQVDRIRAALNDGEKTVPRLDRQEVAAHLRAVGEAFRSEKLYQRRMQAPPARRTYEAPRARPAARPSAPPAGHPAQRSGGHH